MWTGARNLCGDATRERQRGEVHGKEQRCKVRFRLIVPFGPGPPLGALHKKIGAISGCLFLFLRCQFSVAISLHKQATAEENDGRERKRADEPADDKPQGQCVMVC